MNQRELVNADW